MLWAPPVSRDDTGWLSAPLDAGERARLEARVDEELARRPSAGDAVRRVALDEFAATTAAAPPCEIAMGALDAMRGPLFDVARGGPVARIAKRIANLVLRPFALPQRWLNDAIRDALRTEVAAMQAIERDVAATAAALARCEEKIAALESRDVALEQRADADRRT
jgi:hypothetical protein